MAGGLVRRGGEGRVCVLEGSLRDIVVHRASRRWRLRACLGAPCRGRAGSRERRSGTQHSRSISEKTSSLLCPSMPFIFFSPCFPPRHTGDQKSTDTAAPAPKADPDRDLPQGSHAHTTGGATGCGAQMTPAFCFPFPVSQALSGQPVYSV